MSETGDLGDTWVALIEGAANGREEDRSLFSRRYLPAVRAYIAARWRRTSHIGQLEDAVQEVFVECFRSRGALEAFDPEQGSGFRAFLYGVVRNVALRFEREHHRRQNREATAESGHLHNLPSTEDNYSTVFDQALARSFMVQARERMLQTAHVKGIAALQRYEILRQRFEEDLPIREIADRWGQEPARLHREYRKAREEFRACLQQVVAEHSNGKADPAVECVWLLEALE